MRELIFTIAGVKIYAEMDNPNKKALFNTIVSMIRRAYTPIEEKEAA